MTSDDKLVEAVADAIHEAWLSNQNSPGKTFTTNRNNIARAAIRATLQGIREPSAGMIGEAGAAVLNGYVGKDPAEHPYGTAGWAWEAWEAMIDRAISEQGE